MLTFYESLCIVTPRSIDERWELKMKTLTVKACNNDCPFFQGYNSDRGIDEHCIHDDTPDNSRKVVEDAIPPKCCPLRKEPVLVSLLTAVDSDPK